MNGGDPVIFVLTGIAVLLGVIGTVVPLLPGLALVWAAAAFWGFATGFDVVGSFAMLIITAFLLVGVYLSVRIPQRSVSAQGLSLGGMAFGVGMAIAFGIAIPLVGAPLGFVFGVWLVRLRRSGDPRVAFESAMQTTFALIRASAAQFGIAVAMALVWLGWALTG